MIVNHIQLYLLIYIYIYIKQVIQKCLERNNHKVHNSVPYIVLIMPTKSERVSSEKSESVRWISG